MNIRLNTIKAWSIRLFLLATTATLVVSCDRNDELITAEKSIRLDLSTFNLLDGGDTAGGKVWKETYSETTPTLDIGIFKFSHSANASWNYWTGFTISNSSDNTKQTNFVQNQFGAMPQGGANGKGTPFLVAYSQQIPSEKLVANKAYDLSTYKTYVEITDDNISSVKTLNLALSPWTYYNITEGDAYARKFTKGDFYAVHIYGLDSNKKLTSAEPVTYYLADFRNGENKVDTSWQSVNVSKLGKVKYLLFFVETTDVGNYGANTATYFLLDNINVVK